MVVQAPAKTKGLSREGNNSPALEATSEKKRCPKVRARNIKNNERHARRTHKRAGQKGLARLIANQSARRNDASSTQE